MFNPLKKLYNKIKRKIKLINDDQIEIVLSRNIEDDVGRTNFKFYRNDDNTFRHFDSEIELSGTALNRWIRLDCETKAMGEILSHEILHIELVKLGIGRNMREVVKRTLCLDVLDDYLEEVDMESLFIMRGIDE